jgi:hypothetical protein
LPSDLLIAFDAAVYLAGTAGYICGFAVGQLTSNDVRATVAKFHESGTNILDDCRAAILEVTDELSSVRRRAARFMAIEAKNAHLAALDFFLKVSAAIKSAVDEANGRRGRQQCVVGSPRADSAAVIEHFATVGRRLRSEMEFWPSWEEIVAELQIEANKAAEARRATDYAATPDAEQSHAEGHKRRGKRGRKPDTDPEADQRVADAWGTGQYKTYEQCGNALEMTKEQVKNAIDRHRHRSAGKRRRSLRAPE